jgi:hypothetical protein
VELWIFKVLPAEAPHVQNTEPRSQRRPTKEKTRQTPTPTTSPSQMYSRDRQQPALKKKKEE